MRTRRRRHQRWNAEELRRRKVMRDRMAQHLQKAADDIAWNDPEAVAQREAEARAEIEKEASAAFRQMLTGGRTQEEADQT